MYKKIKLRCFTWRDSTQNFFFSNIDTGKTLPKNWRNLSTGLKCFACIYYHLKKFLVQSVYVNQCTLISWYISHTLVWLFFILMPHENEFALKYKYVYRKSFTANFRTSADLWPCAMSILSNLTLIARKWNCFVKKIRYNVLVLCTWFFHYHAIMSSENVFFLKKDTQNFLTLSSHLHLGGGFCQKFLEFGL